ncbi:Serine/threonine-protein kinase PknB [Roseimaritima multifibrata]|uniref:Serine/threonine-protein kinase PknB n=1 Tax=Roseimaritima multifibrata TaxID=1930274 RepID=A0A517MIM0_9BACT|nr:serine/threonine-protein kinase [Roseimaritima multifibrata]QDS94694.1 Serine/threonine-protein kinase PknB [Roseimaritima multifibrata]
MIWLGSHSQLVDDDDEPDFMKGLTGDQKDKLGMLLEQYLAAMESGVPPTVEQLTKSAPELREPLRVCVGGLESLHRMAGGEPAVGSGRGNESLADSTASTEGLVASSTTSDTEPTRLGDFQLHEIIGRGGMGVVYRATQKSLNRTVAVKILPMASVLDPRQLKRFQHEAEAAASLQHPNIVPVHTIGYERGVHFFAMRYIDGESLDQWIERRQCEIQTNRSGRCQDFRSTTPNAETVGEFRYEENDVSDWRTPVRFAIQVAEGLGAAHEYGIVHRDIKPSNLLLDHRDNVWIADFGLARIQNDAALTGSSDVVGTARYMSPEQARGESAIVDGRSDIYSLAATLYEMLTLRPAYGGDDTAAILRQIDDNDITPLRQLCPGLPRDLETVVAKVMSPRRDDRYDTAKEFADDLRRVLTGEPTIARPPTLIDRLVRHAAKHRTAVITTVLVGSLALAGLAVGTTLLAAEKKVSDALLIQAQHDREITREAVDLLGMQISELLADLPDANSVRQRLLSQTLDYYKQIAAASVIDDRDNQQRIDLAVTYGKMGVFQSELGQTADATASLRESERLYAAIAQDVPDDAAVNLQWSISQNNLAERLAGVGEWQSAAEWFAKAIATQERLGNDVELAKTLNNLGGMLSGAGRAEQSQQAYERALGLLDCSRRGQQSQLHEGTHRVGHYEERALESTIQSNLAGLLAKRDPNQAGTLARQSLQYQLGLLEEAPSDPKLATQVMLTLNTLADTQTQTGNHADSAESLRQAVEIGRQLHTRWPDQPIYRRDLVISLNHLGLSLSASGDLKQAQTVLQQAVQHGRALLDVYCENAEVQNMLGGILNNLAFLTDRIGDRHEAAVLYEDAIAHQRRAIELAPKSIKYKTSLKTQQINLKQLRGES